MPMHWQCNNSNFHPGEVSPTGSFKDDGTRNGVVFTNTSSKEIPRTESLVQDGPKISRKTTMDVLQEDERYRQKQIVEEKTGPELPGPSRHQRASTMEVLAENEELRQNAIKEDNLGRSGNAGSENFSMGTVGRPSRVSTMDAIQEDEAYRHQATNENQNNYIMENAFETPSSTQGSVSAAANGKDPNNFTFHPMKPPSDTAKQNSNNNGSGLSHGHLDVSSSNNVAPEHLSAVNDFTITQRNQQDQNMPVSTGDNFGFKNTMPATAPPLRRRDTMDVLRSNEAYRIVDRETKDSGNYQVNSSEVTGLREELRSAQSRALQAEEHLKSLQNDMELKIKSAVEESEKKYNELQTELVSTKNSSSQEIKEITQRYEKQMQDALAVERINQGKILMKKETDFNALLQEQLKSQEDMYKVKLKDMEEKYENQMKLLEQETQHKLDVYKLEMDQVVEKEKKVEEEEAKVSEYEGRRDANRH